MNRYRISKRKLAAIGRELKREWTLSDAQVGEALTEFFKREVRTWASEY